MAGAGRKVFTAGDVLTASQVQDYLQDQAVMVFAGTAARSSAIATPSEGMVAITTDTDELQYYNGSTWTAGLPFGAWQTYAPVISSGGSPAWANGNGTYTYAKFCQIGKTVNFVVQFTLGSTTTKAVSNVMTMTLPVTASTSTAGALVGRATVAGGSYFLNAAINSTTTMQIFAQNSSATYLTLSGITASVPATWVTSDTLTISGTYEAA